MKKINIAVDGYSSCGKSTLAKALASELGYVYIDTGAMYRAVTLFSIKNNLNLNDLVLNLHKIRVSFSFNNSIQKSETLLNGENVEKEIRERKDVAEKVSGVSTIKEVRKKLVSIQKEIGKNGGVVMDGRDIGTVVFPTAELKLFITASVEIRAKRRYEELRAKGLDVSFEEVKKNLGSRDFIDSNRKEDPLRKAEDDVLIDNSHLSISGQLEIALSLARERINN